MGVPPKAFLSYSHDSPDYRDRVLALADRLRDDGIDAMLDQYEEFPPEGWPRWMDRQIRDADSVLLICTEIYLRRVEMREDPGKGHGVLWEANLIYNALYAAGTANRKFVPVLLGAAEPSCIPKPLQGYNHYHADTEEGYQALVRLLTGQPETPMPPLGPRKALPPRERKSAAPPVLWHVPYPRNPFFTGREDVLQGLRDSLAAQGAAALTQTQAISGLGGIGKTQTALEYAYACRHRADYAAVFWLPADSDASLRSAFLAIAAVLDLAAKDAADPAEAVAAVQQWLERNPAWLLIFDNADQPELVRPFLPRQGAGHILVTSRAHALQSLHIAAPLSLDPLPPDQATEFLLGRTGRREAVPEERRAAEDLARDLGYLPLALEQAAAYMAEKPATFTNYLAAYRRRGLELLSHSQPVAGGYPASVATTWALNFEEVEKHPASADVLRLSAFLAPDQIPLELLEPGAPDDPLALDEFLAPATHYSLIRRDLDQKTYSIHRLVQEVVKSRMDEPTRRGWAERAIEAVNGAFPDPEYEHWPRCERLLPHARAAAGLIESWGLESAVASRLLNQAGMYLNVRAQLGEAERFLRRALAIDEKVFGPDHPNVAIRASNLGQILQAKGDLDGALLYTRRALAIGEKVFGPDHPEVATDANNLGSIFYTKGDLDGAFLHTHRALEIDEKAFGSDHPNIARDANNLGQILHAKGDLDGASLYTRRALEIDEKVLGSDHPTVATLANNLGQILKAKGDLDGALLYTRRALAVDEKAFGPDHPSVATDANNLGQILQAKGDLGGALHYIRRALEIFSAAYGPDHPHTKLTARNLSSLEEKLRK